VGSTGPLPLAQNPRWRDAGDMPDDLEKKTPSTVSLKSHSVLLAETRCVSRTLVMLARNEVTMPTGNLGRTIRFADGTASQIYRETATGPTRADDLVLLAVRFRLRFIGMSRFWHFAFRVESLLNTVLFAAHRGFHTKLWLTDRETGFYRGIYEWRGRDAAFEYLETLRVVLTPWAQTGSFAYEVVEGVSREDYVDGCVPAGWNATWCLPVRSRDHPDTGLCLRPLSSPLRTGH